MTQTTATPNLIAWSAAALGISLVHVLIDYHIGLYGKTAASMSPLQAANAFLTSAVFGWWLLLLGLASQGNKGALFSALRG